MGNTIDSLHEEEVWKPIPNHLYYEASSLGRIRSIGRVTNAGWRGRRTMPGKVIKPRLLNSGYLRVCLSEEGRIHYCLVHVLVAMAFHGLSPGSHGKHDTGDNYHVDHKNEVATDNRADNLQWLRQWKNVGAKLTPEQANEVRQLYATGQFFQRELAERFSVTRECISRIITQKNWKHAT